MLGPARAAAHPDAVLHGARRARRAHVGALRDRLHRLLLPHHPDRRLRRLGAGRPRDHREVDAGGNMAAPLVAELLGGTPFLGFIAAVAFATILAVVAGLTLAGASALSHDIFVARRQARARRPSTSRFGSRASRRWCSASRRRSWASSSRARTSRSWSASRSAIAASANFPAAAAVDRLEAVHDGRRRHVDRQRRRSSSVLLIVAQSDGLGRPAPQRAGRSSRSRIPAIVSMPRRSLSASWSRSLHAGAAWPRRMFEDEKLRDVSRRRRRVASASQAVRSERRGLGGSASSSWKSHGAARLDRSPPPLARPAARGLVPRSDASRRGTSPRATELTGSRG